MVNILSEPVTIFKQFPLGAILISTISIFIGGLGVWIIKALIVYLIKKRYISFTIDFDKGFIYRKEDDRFVFNFTIYNNSDKVLNLKYIKIVYPTFDYLGLGPKKEVFPRRKLKQGEDTLVSAYFTSEIKVKKTRDFYLIFEDSENIKYKVDLRFFPYKHVFDSKIGEGQYGKFKIIKKLRRIK